MRLAFAALAIIGPQPKAPPEDLDTWICIRGVIALLFLVGLVALIVRGGRHKKARRLAQEQERWNYLVQRFGPDIAPRIARREVWAGQTVDMLLESRGRPVATDEEVMKTKTKVTFKYDPIGRNRYGTRIVVENGIVVGWDHKGG